MSNETQIKQTLGEIDLEKNSLLAWPEPQGMKSIRPRYGKASYPYKLIFAFLLVYLFIAYLFFQTTESFSFIFTFKYWLSSTAVATLSITVVTLMDSFHVKNIWLYKNCMLRTHSNSKQLFMFSNIEKCVVYKLNFYVIELVTNKGKSTVIGVSDAIDITLLMNTLQKTGVNLEKNF